MLCLQHSNCSTASDSSIINRNENLNVQAGGDDKCHWRLVLMSKLHCNTSSANLAHIARTAYPVLLLLLSGGRGASLNPTEADKPKHVLLIWGPLSSLATYHKGTAGQCPAVSKGCPVSQGTLSLCVDAQPATGNPELFGYLGLHASNQALGQSRPPMWVQKPFRG